MIFDSHETTETAPSTTAAVMSPEAVLPRSRLHPAAERVLQSGPRDRMVMAIRDHVIHYPALDQIITEAEWMVYEPRQTRARGLIVVANRGNGKTSLSRLIHGRFDAYDSPGLPCVLRISISGVRDARSLYGRILEELGSPARISHRLSDRELLVQRLLREVDCRLLVLDEVQDVLLGSDREQQRALEGIKLLMNELSLPILAFGTDRAGQGFGADPHLQARFSHFAMPTWKADNTLANFLATYERLLPLKEPSNLAAAEKVAYLARMSEGVLGKIVTRVQNAALAAIVDGTEHITIAHLKAAVTRPAVCGLRPDNADG